jgi:hypothetical protein
MKTLPPTTREIRFALEEILPDMLPERWEDGVLEDEAQRAKSQKEVTLALVRRFPNVSAEALAGALNQAYEIHRAALRRAGDRLALDAQRGKALADFLVRKMYANLQEAMDDLGLLSPQEAWDLVMDEAGLPPSEAPETLES